MKTGIVYIIKMGETNNYKIGITTNMKSRLSQLQMRINMNYLSK